jgi:hypothetical protein
MGILFRMEQALENASQDSEASTGSAGFREPDGVPLGTPFDVKLIYWIAIYLEEFEKTKDPTALKNAGVWISQIPGEVASAMRSRAEVMTRERQETSIFTNAQLMLLYNIRESGESGITATILAKKSQSMSSSERRKTLDVLLEKGYIRSERIKTGLRGSPAETFFATW